MFYAKSYHWLGGTLVLIVLLPGCGRPHPGTWWGPRQVRERRSERRRRKTQLAAQPQERRRRSLNPFRRGKGEPPIAATTSGGEQQTKISTSSPELEKAKELAKASKFNAAKTLLLEVLDREPNNAEAWRWLGDCHYNRFEFEAALKAYDQAWNADRGNYFALRGKGFSGLHQGHEIYRHGDSERRSGNLEKAREKFREAHELYATALSVLQKCLDIRPGDVEAMYGRAMAAEGYSRRLYATATGLLKKGESAKAHRWAEECLAIMGEGIKAINVRIEKYPRDPDARALAGGLLIRRAWLLKKFGRTQKAIIDLTRAATMQRYILENIDDRDAKIRAQAHLENYEKLQRAWRAEAEAAAG